MRTMKDAKNYGGIGAILLLIGAFIPYVGVIVSLVGLIFVFIAVKTVSEITKEKKIFNHFLYYFILTITAVIAMGAILIGSFFAVGGISFFETLEHMDPSNPEAILEFVAPFLGGVILALVVGWIFFIVSSIYLRKSYTAISEKTNVDAFKTAGLLYFIGALTVIIIVGFIIMFIARIFEIIAYFGLPEEYNDQTISPLDQKFEKII